MSAQPLTNRSSPRASGADPRSQSGQRLGNRSVANIAKTFLAVMACGLLVGFGLAYLFQNSPVPASGPGSETQILPPAIATNSTADEEVAPVSRLPAPIVEQPLVMPVQPAPVVATSKQPSTQTRVHRAQATQRVSRRPPARTRLGTWLRQTREKILSRRREANSAKRRKKKESPCKCACNVMSLSSTALKA